MKGAAVTLAALLSATAAAQVVHFGVEKRQHTTPRLRRRASTVESSIANEIENAGYYIDATVGTPGQKLSLQLDTGSSDVWVPFAGSEACSVSSNTPKRPGQSDNCSKGAFNPDDSSSYEEGEEGTFEIQYVDQSSARGSYFQDRFEVGGAAIKNLTMGLAESTNIPFGIVGVGYTNSEASLQTVRDTYPNLPVAMRDSGFIKTIAYSLWLNDLQSSKGSLLFGGIDTEKFEGQLAQLDVKPVGPGVYAEFVVPLTSVSGVSSSGTDEFMSNSYPINALLDSGTTLSYLPMDLAKQVWQEAGAVYLGSQDIAIVPCKYGQSKAYFSFGFGGQGGPIINVTMNELVLDTVGSLPFPSGPAKGKPACTFGIQAQSSNDESEPFLLGDTFLRSAYVVYDLVNNKIGLAPTKFNASASNVVPFASMGAPIPSATVVKDQNSTTTSGPQSAPTTFAASDGFQENAGTNIPVSGLALASISTVFALLAAFF